MTTTKIKNDVMCLTLTTNNVKKAVKTYTMSKRYINTMLKASVTNILYHRLNINENEFISKKFNDVSFKTFRSKSKDKLIRNYHKYMLACKDALDKNYLRDFYLFFVDTASGDIVENYKFSFQYYTENKPQQSQTSDNLIESTAELLRALEDFSTYKKINDEITVKVEIAYFDDAPQDYEPPGFESIEGDYSLIKKLDKRGNSVIIGNLFTGFHTLKCRAKGEIFNFNSSTPMNSIELVAPENDVSIVEVDLSNNNEEKMENNEVFTEDYSISPAEAANEDKNVECLKINDSDTIHGIDLSTDDESQFQDCPCKMADIESFAIDQIECKICKRIYHSPCQGYLDNTFVNGPFCCIFCRVDTDSLVNAFDTTQSTFIYRIRFIIGVIYKFGRAPDEIKATFPETLDKMKTLHIFELKGDRISKCNEKVLESLFKFAYKKPDLSKFQTL